MAINNFNVGVGTTSQLTRYRYVATGGETSVSGSDADGKTLSYTVGLEQVFLNGVNLVRGQDYTATNGTSVGSLTALVASDVVEVFAYVPFNIANALTVSTVDAKGDLLVGTGADAVGRLAVGTNNQLLAADSSTGSGLKWANPGLTLITTQSFSAVTSFSFPASTFSATYSNYRILIYDNSHSTGSTTYWRMRAAGSDATGSNYQGNWWYWVGSSANAFYNAATNAPQLSDNPANYIIDIFNPFVAAPTYLYAISGGAIDWKQARGSHDLSTSYDSMSFIRTSGTMTGTYSVYGYNK
jgi:hypothetical protein